ncbi:hypothetical protein [Sulfurimonas sp.]|uniref:hypothetical protein n=1 Tax=Sulfurimonas sp. TaxID=2022749 RepID=UPI003562D554
MDGILYPASLVLLILLAFTFNQSNNTVLALIMIIVGIYIVYSHETGETATDWKNNIVKSIDEEAQGFSEKRGLKGHDINMTK